MRKARCIRRLLMLVFMVLFMLGGTKINAEAKSASVSLNKTSGVITVSYKGSVIGTTAYKRETVYAYTDITFERRGPGTSYSKVKKMKKDMGESFLRIGNFKGKWSIVIIDGKYYFISNSHVSTLPPTKKLTKKKYTARQLKRKGVIRWNGWRWTWYSQRVLRGSHLHIPGRHVDKNKFVCDKDGYICLASGRLRKGTIVRTPFGKKGKVYDSGCARNTLDVYTNF